MTFPRRTILLAGAGDLGRRTGQILADLEHDVWGLRRSPAPLPNDPIHWVSADLTVADTLRALPTGITHVLYAATPGARDPDHYRRIFIEGLHNLLEAIDPDALERFIFVSSTAVYGASDDWLDEESETAPEAFNGRILVEAEQQLHAMLPGKAVALRLSGLYGPGRTGLLDRIQQGLATVPDGPGHWSNRFHIEDAARACAHLLLLPQAHSCYIGTDNHPRPIAELYDALADMLRAPRPTREPASAPTGKRLSNARLRDSGFEPAWPDALPAYRTLIAQDYPRARC
ncbi:NAD-dependent epimerase/dehydratase family protein [Parapusillimonas sp. SGNA-6]|nr:NAD-dependent epimerase/dehydratase family protein [Parapusillimonas sp. SGNA-6]